MSQSPEPRSSERNVLGTELEACGDDPVTGFYRDGRCSCGPEDVGVHAVCTVMTQEFLDHQLATGNDLVTPRPELGFPGLQPGDRWCVVAARWAHAYEQGVRAPVVLAATSEKALEVVPLEWLDAQAVDIPDDPSWLT
jgi:uncharacterized protein (DUF2237 family)